MDVPKSFFDQTFRIPAPSLTEKNLPDQTGRVVIVTGGYAGVGQELSRILYQNNATVYIAGRSASKASASIESTKSLFPTSKGRLEFMSIDLSDLYTIKRSVAEFLGKEKRLDVLVNNAGVMFPPEGSKSIQGHELQMSTNVLGHYLLSSLLLPILKSTAKTSPKGSVRILWAGSLGINVISPSNGGVNFDSENNVKVQSKSRTNYGQSKAANLFLAISFGKLLEEDGILSLAFNPGNLRSELQRHSGWFERITVEKALMYPAVFGAYTELWAGWAPEAKEMAGKNGKGLYVIPWGRNGWTGLRSDVLKASESEEEGGVKEKLWDWCEKETKEFR